MATGAANKMMSLHRRGLRKASAMCARAFAGAPHISYFFPDEVRREHDTLALFEMRIRYGLLKGEIHATSANVEGIAVWIPSKHAGMTMWGQIRSGGIRLYRTVGGDAVARMTHVENHNDRLRETLAPKPFMFLSILAVDPAHQRQGYATRLLETMLPRLDRDRTPCYLETTEESMVSFYRRFGFLPGDASAVPGTDVKVWPMLRRPPCMGRDSEGGR